MELWASINRTTSVLLFALALVIASIGHVASVSAQIDEAAALKEQAQKLFDERRYADAEPLFKRSLEILEKFYGRDHLYVASSLLYLARVYTEEGRYIDAEPLLQRALKILETSQGPDHLRVANALNSLALIYVAQGHYAKAEPLFKRALAITEKNLGFNHPTVAAALNSLALLYSDQGRYSDSEPLYKRSLTIVESSLGPNHPNVAKSLNNLAVLYYREGHYLDAERLFTRSLVVEQSALGPDHPDIAGTLNNLALLYDTQGRYAETESLYKRALALKEKARGPDHPDVAVALHNLAAFYHTQGRYDDAEPLFMRALSIRETAFGSDNPDVALLLNNLAELYSDQGRNAEAELLYKRALTIQERDLGPHHPVLATSLNNLAMLYVRLGRTAEAETLLLRALAIREKALGPNHSDFATSLNNLAVLYQKQSRYADAEPLYRRAMTIRETTLGPNHPNVAHSLYDLAALYVEQRRFADALPLIRRAASAGFVKKWIYFPVLKGAVANSLVTNADSVEESFLILQQATASAASNAINQLSVRFAAGNNQLAQIVRRDQDLFLQSQQLDKLLIEAASKEPNQRNADAEQSIRIRAQEITTEHAKILATLNQSFPSFAELSKPAPLSVKDTQRYLTADEALVAFDFGDKSYVWIVTRTSVDWLELKITAKELETQVTELRSSLKNDAKPFDASAAYKLYQATFGIFVDQLKSITRLSIVANGALSSLPLQLLVTKDPTGKSLKDTAWLVRTFAVTNLPSVSSLKTLRGASFSSPATKPMIAFADPVFSKVARQQANKTVAIRGLASFATGTQIDTAALAENLTQLPSTRQEVNAIAKVLQVNTTDLHFGLDATETAVKNEKLDQYRIVYFATHGLVVGDLEKFAKRKIEPALALSFPDKPNDLDDGLLTASEIAQLNLNADWVVLSACNTAAEEKPGAEPLSGLARAFFYAGARSLLVSHWEVDDEATATLMTGIFVQMKNNPKLSHGEALRQSMLAMINNAKTEHPYFWAPFVVVGEPAKLN